jgi:heat shock protein HslJ
MNLPRAWQLVSTLFAALCLTTTALLPPTQAATEELSSTAWQLVQFQGANGQILRPEDGSNYTVEFKPDSTVAVRLACHRGLGTWTSTPRSQLALGPLALTRATCPQATLSDQIATQWPSLRSYALRNNHLFLSSMADGGTYEFEPARAVPAAQSNTASWLDESTPVAWNTPGAAIPTAPKLQGTAEPRCRALARTPELEADKRLTDLGWDLIGAYQGGWGILVIQGAAGYDGMCRPRAYQEFVFVHGVFAGTLSPRAMDARTDGALNRVTLQDNRRLVAEYARYTGADALCCPSKTASVVFEIGPGQAAVVRPMSSSISSNR